MYPYYAVTEFLPEAAHGTIWRQPWSLTLPVPGEPDWQVDRQLYTRVTDGWVGRFDYGRDTRFDLDAEQCPCFLCSLQAASTAEDTGWADLAIWDSDEVV